MVAATEGDDLDAEIRRTELHLAHLHQRRRERDHAALLLAILKVTDTWFRTHELLDAVVVSSELARWFAGKSAKSVGRLLRAIADAQDRQNKPGPVNSSLPALRLLRLERTNGGALWKVETH